jgi:outer membrane lipopolysaccharide assembly protein LptE/RlpB
MKAPATHLARLVSLALLLASSGCGYSLAGRGSFLPAYIQAIGVPNFTNSTPVIQVEQRISERVRSELIGRGRYRVEPATTGVDAVLLGEITSITIAPVAVTQQQTASRYVLTLTARVEFKDLKTDKVIWSNPAMPFREEYDVSTATAATDPNAFFGQDQNALDRLATEFARTLVSAILEAF